MEFEVWEGIRLDEIRLGYGWMHVYGFILCESAFIWGVHNSVDLTLL